MGVCIFDEYCEELDDFHYKQDIKATQHRWEKRNRATKIPCRVNVTLPKFIVLSLLR